jgi:hypothetical protein
MENDLPLGELTGLVIERFHSRINIYDSEEKFLLGYNSVPQYAADIFVCSWCISEVCNGGFHQFFLNSTGIVAPEAVNGFHRMGLLAASRIVRSAMNFFGDEFPRDRDVRIEKLEEVNVPNASRGEWDPFEKLDNQLFDWLKIDDDQGYNYAFYHVADRYAAKHENDVLDE